MKPPAQNKFFFMWVKGICPDAIEEYQFCPIRKFRADVFVPSLNVLIEYEGINSAKSGHTTMAGYTKDCDKYNLASLMGFKLLRYTALNKSDILRDITALRKGFKIENFKTKKQVFKELLQKAKKKC